MRYKIDEIVQLIMDYRGKTPKKLGMNWTESQKDIIALSAKNIKDNKIVNTDKSHYGSELLYKHWMKDGDIEPGDILMTSEAPLGEIYLVSKPIKAILSQRLFLLRFNKKIVNPWYMYAFMNSQSFKNQLLLRATGTTVVGIKQKDLRKIEVELPSRELQNKIGSIFQFLYKKIHINGRINDNLFELAKIFFDYVKTSTTKKFSDIVSIQNGFAFKSKNYVKDKQLVILRTKNINSNNLFESKDVVYIPYSLKDQYSRFAFKKFDSVLVMIGSNIGKTGFVTSNNLPSLQNQNMWRFRSTNKNISGLLIYEYVNFINNKVKNSAVGSARAFYKKELFVDYPVPIIKKDNNFVFKKLELEINNICKETDTLLLLKELLLNIYF